MNQVPTERSCTISLVHSKTLPLLPFTTAFTTRMPGNVVKSSQSVVSNEKFINHISRYCVIGLNGIQEVVGSIPSSSTTLFKGLDRKV